MNKAVAISDMIIRRAPAAVFDAFVNPDIIRKFWLKDTSGPLSLGAKVEWHFMVPGAIETVSVTAFKKDHHITFDWSDGISVDMAFQPYGGNGTRITVKAVGFTGNNAAVEAVNATEGFTIVLCDLKGLLESGSSPNLVKDKAELIALSISTESSHGA